MKAATIGTFDGLHKGHLKVLDTLKSEAARRGLQPLVMTFDRHPLETVAPERAPGAVCPPSDKTNELYRSGLNIHVIEFGPSTAALTAAEWMRRLHDTFGVRLLVVGYDNTFGCDGLSMSVADYTRLGREVGIEVIEAPVEKGVSSSAVRKALAGGDLKGAETMLGHRFALAGTVGKGRGVGSGLGFPTANVAPEYKAQLPADGVYAATALTEEGDEYPAVVNIGMRPTFGNLGERTVEAHLIGFDGNLYGTSLRLVFLHRIRNEKKFDDVSALMAQIRKDIDSVINRKP